MIRIHGVPVTNTDARALAATLLAARALDAIHAANAISVAIEYDSAALTLGTDQRNAVLRVLDQPPPRLAELRDALGRDVELRHGE